VAPTQFREVKTRMLTLNLYSSGGWMESLGSPLTAAEDNFPGAWQSRGERGWGQRPTNNRLKQPRRRSCAPLIRAEKTEKITAREFYIISASRCFPSEPPPPHPAAQAKTTPKDPVSASRFIKPRAAELLAADGFRR
jgi:hypothetical protein